MVLGTAEFFARPFKNRMVGVAVGTAIAGFLRFMCSFLSGVLVWGNLNEGLSAWTYSPRVQRQLYAAGDAHHCGGRCAAHQGSTPDLRPSVHQSLSSSGRKSRRRQKCPRRDFLHEFEKAVDNSPFSWYNNTRRQGRHRLWGLAQLGERLHGMQEVSGSIPLFSTKSTVLRRKYGAFLC